MEVKHPLLLEVYQQCRVQIFDTVFAFIEQLSYDLESVRNLFYGPMFGKIKTKLLLIPTKETSNVGSKQFVYPITLLRFK